jgi:hypothetical protein
MLNEFEIEHFELYVDWTIRTLKTQDKLMTDTFKRGIRTLISFECLQEILLSALQFLAETDQGTGSVG